MTLMVTVFYATEVTPRVTLRSDPKPSIAMNSMHTFAAWERWHNNCLFDEFMESQRSVTGGWQSG
jgi:hypothetical protein